MATAKVLIWQFDTGSPYMYVQTRNFGRFVVMADHQTTKFNNFWLYSSSYTSNYVI